MPLKQGPARLEKLPVPMERTVDEFRHRFAETQKAIDRHERPPSRESPRSELTNKQLSLEELHAEQQIPSREELLAQRAHRARRLAADPVRVHPRQG